MQTESLLVRRAATVSPQDAKARLAEKYPAYKLVEFKTEIDNNNNQFYVASLMKAAEHPEVGVEPLDVGGPESPPEPESEAPEAPKEEHKEEKSEGGLEHKLDKILDMLHTLVGGGDDAPAPEDSGPVDSKPLPPPVPEPLPSMGQTQHPMFAKKQQLTVVRENSKNTRLAEAKAELDAEFNQHGFKVAKMVRRDDKIVAGLVRIDNGV
jgi:hypothetical protein